MSTTAETYSASKGNLEGVLRAAFITDGMEAADVADVAEAIGHVMSTVNNHRGECRHYSDYLGVWVVATED